jgi:hypothetical protein
LDKEFEQMQFCDGSFPDRLEEKVPERLEEKVPEELGWQKVPEELGGEKVPERLEGKVPQELKQTVPDELGGEKVPEASWILASGRDKTLVARPWLQICWVYRACCSWCLALF